MSISLRIGKQRHDTVRGPPLKMLSLLVFLIFLAIYVIILGPAFPMIFSSFRGQ